MTRSASLCVLLLLLAGCDDAWKQFHGGAANSGFYDADTDYALESRWSVEVGRVVYSSPAAGADGTIYVGNMDGELVAVAPGGAILWRRPFPGSTIMASPAVGPDGNIYVISNRALEDGTLQSRLHQVEPDGSLAWTFTYSGYTTSSPKVWEIGQGVQIFAQIDKVDTSLVIVDASGNLVLEDEVTACPHVIVGDGWNPLDLLEAFAEILAEFPVDFDPASLDREIPEEFGWLTPTVAIAGKPGDPEIGIVVAGRCQMAGLRWRPPVLEEVWKVDFGEEPRRFSSPAVFANGLLALGGQAELTWWCGPFGQGRVYAFDAATGTELWSYETPDAVMATPASFGRQIYVASLHDLHVLDSDGDLLFTEPLGKDQTAASVALSNDLGYVGSTAGLHSFDFDFLNYVVHSAAPGPLSSPLIAEDGTVYAISGKKLFAFAP